MSLYQTEEVPCPSCGHSVTFNVNYSINADRRPDLRQAILDGTFQRGTCNACGNSFRLDPELSYMDMGRKQWFLVCPAGKLEHWNELEQQARATFDKAYGTKAGGTAQRLGADIRVRVTFGWAAMREKLLCADQGLDDVTIELVKLALIQAAGSLPLSDDAELRLMDVEGDQLVFAWLVATNERLLDIQLVPKSLYDDIASEVEPWRELRNELSAGTFVDVHRLLVAQTPIPEAP